MKYTYQDSTELPVQRDFIEDLQYFIEVASQAIPLENSAIEVKDRDEDGILQVEDKLNKINKFEKEVINSIKSTEMEEDIKEVLEIKKAAIDACASTAEKEKEKFETELKQLKAVADKNIGQFESKMLTMINKLFANGVYGAHKRYSAAMNGGKLTGTLKASLAEMEYRSNLTFDNNVLIVRDIVSKLSIPTWTKAGILHRENKVKMVNVSDFIINSINYDGDRHLETSFADRKAERSFRIVSDGETYKVYQADQEITADSTLSKSINIPEIASMVEGVKKYVQTRISSQKLMQVLIDGMNAIKRNEIFDCLKIIAEQYGDIVRECIEKGYVENEITIKIEEEDGTRTEKYASKEEIFKKLSELGSEGLELAGILGIEK